MEIKFSQVDSAYIQPTDPCRLEKNLLAAILEKAIEDAAGCFDIRPSGVSPAYCAHQALEWIESDDPAYCELSFVRVCEWLNFDPLAIRSGVLSLINRAKTTGAQRIFEHRRESKRPSKLKLRSRGRSQKKAPGDSCIRNCFAPTAAPRVSHSKT